MADSPANTLWLDDYEWGICWDFERSSWGYPEGQDGGRGADSAAAPGGRPPYRPARAPAPAPMPVAAMRMVGPAPPPPPTPPPPTNGGAANGWASLPAGGHGPQPVPPWFMFVAPGGMVGGKPAPQQSQDGPYIGDVVEKAGASVAWWAARGRGWGQKGAAKGWAVAPEGGGGWPGGASRGAAGWERRGGRGGGGGGGGWKGGWDQEAGGGGAVGTGWGGGPAWEEPAEGRARSYGGNDGRAGAGRQQAWWQAKPAPEARQQADDYGYAAGSMEAAAATAYGAAWNAAGATAAAGNPRDEVAAEVELLLARVGPQLEAKDFDFRVRRLLTALWATGGRGKVRDALSMVGTYTSQKSRESVANWPAYLLTLLKKFEPEAVAAADGKGEGKGRGRKGGGRGGGRDGPPAAAVAVGTAQRHPSPLAPVPSGGRGPEPSRPAPGAREGDAAAPPPQASAPAAAGPGPPAAALPAGWDAGRQALLTELDGSLGHPSCAFTGQPLDCEAALVARVAACFEKGAAPGPPALRRHVLGVAASLGLSDFPRSAAAAAVAASGVPELAALADDATAADAAAALADAALGVGPAANASAAALQDLSIELTAEVLRNHRISPTGPRLSL